MPLMRERMDRTARSMIIKGVLSLLALSVGVYLTGSVLWGAVGLALAWMVVLLGYDVRSSRMILNQPEQAGKAPPSDNDITASALQPRWEPRTLWTLALTALPLGFVMMLISLNTNIPRYFIEARLGEAQLGIFAAMAYLMVAGTAVVNALGQSAAPRMSCYYADGRYGAYLHLLGKLVLISASLGTAGIIVALVAGQLVLNLLYGPAYAVHADVFLWIVIAGAINYTVGVSNYAVIAARIFWLQLATSAISVLAIIMLSFLLIPVAGLKGAALVLVIGSLIRLLLKATEIGWALRRPAVSAQIPGHMREMQ